MPRRLIVTAALGLTLVGVGEARSGATAGSASKPRTLVSVSGRIAAFAQDAGRIAWSTEGWSECEKPVHILTLSTGARAALPSKPGPCENISGNPPSPVGTLALAGDRALWAVAGASNTEIDGMFVTAAVHDRSERRACKFSVLRDSEQSTLATAGGGQTLAFTMTGEPFPEGGGVCSGLWLVGPDGSASRSAATPSVLLAVGGTQIALVTEARSSAELRSGQTGGLIATVSAAGRVQAIALSQSTVALLVGEVSGRHIELFDSATTASQGTVSVPASTAPELSAAGANIVFRVRNTIYLLDGRNRTKQILATAGSTPIGLSIEGRRVAWAENDFRGGRIRAIILAGR